MMNPPDKPRRNPFAPHKFSVGEKVICPAHPDWGIGEILKKEPIPRDENLHRMVLVCPFHIGSFLTVRFGDGRMRRILTGRTEVRPVGESARES